MTIQITQTLSSGNILVVAPEATFGDIITVFVFLLLLVISSLNILLDVVHSNV